MFDCIARKFFMPAKKNKETINLLPQEEFAKSTLGRVLTWLLSTFRIIVIVTEVLVMAAFLSRFWLDARANDLNDQIRQKTALIKATQEFEKTFRLVQKKLDSFSKIVSSQNSISANLKLTAGYLPPDVILTSIQADKNTIQLKGISLSEGSIAQFITNLKSDKSFTNVVISGINSGQKENTMITFNVKADISNKK